MIRFVVLAVLLGFPGLAWGACTPIAQGGPAGGPVGGPVLWRAAAGDTTVTITFLGHASFEIETPSGVRVVTDYNGFNIPADPPDIATMNHAHSTHYTLTPDPRVKHVLHGWKEQGEIPSFDLVVRDLRVTNLPTNIRDWGGGTELYGNSIFLFEAAGLCIAHLSHLHHLLEPADIDRLGRVDILMVPVDGIWTMSQSDAVKVVEQLQPRLVLPMHYFTRDVLVRYLDLVKGTYDIELRDTPVLQISRLTLPDRPTMIALPGGY